MARTTVAYWQHVGTGEVFAVRVDDDGAIVSAHGPLTPADVSAVIFGDLTPTDEETGATPLDHLRSVILGQDTEYLALAPYRRPSTGCRDEGKDGA